MSILEVTLLVAFAVTAAFWVASLFELADSRRQWRELFDLNKSMLENNAEMRKLTYEALELATSMHQRRETEES